MGRAETMVTCPLTGGSISMLRPVICDIAFTTACRSAPWKLSTTSPARGVTATAAPGARAGGAAAGDPTGAPGTRPAGTAAAGDSAGAVSGDPGGCAATAWGAGARGPARVWGADAV